MAGKVHERLVELEKNSAPFEHQLEAAAKYIRWDWETKGPTGNAPIGSEDWVLKWLMRRLQDPKNCIPRNTARSWILFLRLIQAIHFEKVYKALDYRKFMPILKQTLEEAQQLMRPGEVAIIPQGKKVSNVLDMLFAISAAIQHMFKMTTSRGVTRLGLSTAGYMQKLLEFSSEDAAKLLGLWLSLSRSALSSGINMSAAELGTWLSPFIGIWKLRCGAKPIAETTDAMLFSIHCTEHLLSLLHDSNQRLGRVVILELDKLAAENIILSAEVAFLEQDPDSSILSSLTRLSVLQDSFNAYLLFHIAIRISEPKESPRRREWLQSVFNNLRKDMPNHRPDQNTQALQDMLSSALQFGAVFDLPLLRSITVEYALRGDFTNWGLLSTIAMINSDVFLLQNDEKNLLQEVLAQITAALPQQCDEATDVAATLMEEFAKARDLSGFIRHWYAELVELERFRKTTASKAVLSAWEADALREKLAGLLESSLTISQISQLLEWLSEEVKVSPGAVSVILDAICWSIDYWEVVNAVGTTLYHIIFENEASERLGNWYKWRFWRILSRIISWEMPEHHDEISRDWSNRSKPFDSFFDVLDENTTELEALERLRFGCTAWKYARKDCDLHNFAKPFESYDLDSSDLTPQLVQSSKIKGNSLAITPTSPENLESDEENVNSIRGRQSIIKQIREDAKSMNEDQKLQLLETLCGNETPISLTSVELFKVYHVLKSFNKLPPRKYEEAGYTFDLSSAYAALCSRMYRAVDIVQFSLIAETLEDMLRTKARAISPWNIDSTLGSIVIMCSQKGPALNPAQAGNVYLHLCRLFQAILVSHRISLDNHFHLVVQTMQALMRCLFTPSHLSTSRIRKTFPPPPWLTDAKNSRLTAIHAESYTRLVTTICNPSISAVTRKQDNNLTSKTEKAKRMAGQHLKYVLTSYIQLQLDMTILPEMRGKMVPGIRAIFDTTKEDSRKGIYNEIDRDGRTLFEELYKDWDRFGRWKGV